MPKIKRTYAAPRDSREQRAASPDARTVEQRTVNPLLAGANPVGGPKRRFTDYDVDKLVFWVCVLLFAIAFTWVK
jgi:hypothetical protein